MRYKLNYKVIINMSNLVVTPFLFDNLTIRTMNISGEPWFVGRDVAEALGYKDTTNAIKQHCKGVVKHHPLQTPGGMQEVRVINEPDVLRLILSSNLPAAQRFERWVFEDVLPSIRKTGSYTPQNSAPLTLPLAEEAIRVGNALAQVLNLHGTAKLNIIEGALKIKAPEYIPLLPAYATNAPRAMDGKLIGCEAGSAPAFSATKLLSGTGISARKFNQLAFEAGFLVSKERFSTTSPSGTKAFWSISESGSEFGYNLTNPKNERETQPYWYEDKFADLLSLMLPPDAMQSATAK